jgi:hypothetical protein
MNAVPLFHYTDSFGYNAIRAHPVWRFLARQPPGNRPVGAYFTYLPPDTPKLAKRLRIPRSKLAYVFVFADIGDLQILDGGRGDYIVYSPVDYEVVEDRQIHSGPTGLG